MDACRYGIHPSYLLGINQGSQHQLQILAALELEAKPRLEHAQDGLHCVAGDLAVVAFTLLEIQAGVLLAEQLSEALTTGRTDRDAC